MSAPIIDTERLRLRGHRRDDYEAAYAMWSDPIVTRYIGGKPSTSAQTWARLLGYLGHWDAMGYGYWAIEDRAAGTFVGEIGFADFKRDIIPAMRDVPEVGFALVSHVHGRGYATEALRAVLDWGDVSLPSKRTVCLVSDENRASLHIVETAGYRAFERALFNGLPVTFLERDSQLTSWSSSPP